MENKELELELEYQNLVSWSAVTTSTWHDLLVFQTYNSW